MAINSDPLTVELHPPLGKSEAMVEADRCLRCAGGAAVAPCQLACPARVDIPRFVDLIAQDRPGDAAAVIWRRNLLGASCARVCPVAELCEGACVLRTIDRPAISIAALQRYATETALGTGRPLRHRSQRSAAGGEVAVVGGGPAGLVCAGELAARGHNVTVYERYAQTGGLARSAIAPYKLKDAPLDAETAALRDLGVRFVYRHQLDARQIRRLLERGVCVFLGVGMAGDSTMHLPGEHLPGVWESLDFIAALKDGTLPRLRGNVAVLGAGNTAIDAARLSLRAGARTATLIYRRSQAEMPAYAHEYEEALDEGVGFLWLTAPLAFGGRARLRSLRCQPMILGERDTSGRRRPQPQGAPFRFAADVAVKAFGQRPHTQLLEDLGLALTRAGLPQSTANGRTDIAGLFVAGDAVSGGATVVAAVASARAAAVAIDREIRSRP